MSSMANRTFGRRSRCFDPKCSEPADHRQTVAGLPLTPLRIQCPEGCGPVQIGRHRSVKFLQATAPSLWKRNEALARFAYKQDTQNAFCL